MNQLSISVGPNCPNTVFVLIVMKCTNTICVRIALTTFFVRIVLQSLKSELFEKSKHRLKSIWIVIKCPNNVFVRIVLATFKVRIVWSPNAV